MGMKYCKRKIPRLRKFLLKVVISFPVIRENQEELDNEMWSVERSSAYSSYLLMCLPLIFVQYSFLFIEISCTFIHFISV